MGPAVGIAGGTYDSARTHDLHYRNAPMCSVTWQLLWHSALWYPLAAVLLHVVQIARDR